MSLKVRPGTAIRFEIVTQDPDTLAPIGGLPVFLDFFAQPAAAPQQLAGAETASDGRVEINATVPELSGSYRYRARTTGVAEKYRSDVGPLVTVEVVG